MKVRVALKYISSAERWRGNGTEKPRSNMTAAYKFFSV